MIAAARAEGIPDAWLDAARNSPVYKMAIEWKVAFPLHPGIPHHADGVVRAAAVADPIGGAGQAHRLRRRAARHRQAAHSACKYLANLLTAGDTKPVEAAIKRMFAMRIFMRSRHVERKDNDAVLAEVGMTRPQMENMYKTMALAAYEDRFVIPSSHREYAENAYDLRGSCGFSFGNGCSDGASEFSLFGQKKFRENTPTEVM